VHATLRRQETTPRVVLSTASRGRAAPPPTVGRRRRELEAARCRPRKQSRLQIFFAAESGAARALSPPLVTRRAPTVLDSRRTTCPPGKSAWLRGFFVMHTAHAPHVRHARQCARVLHDDVTRSPSTSRQRCRHATRCFIPGSRHRYWR
jgi:hypothetical protein